MALCLAQVLRMYAPKTPFSNEQLKVELSVLCCTLLFDALLLLRLTLSCCLLGCLACTVPAFGLLHLRAMVKQAGPFIRWAQHLASAASALVMTC